MENTQSKWTIDPGHSKVQFKVKHLAIANVAGIFKVFSGQVLSPTADFDNATVTFELDAQSIDTGHEQRDGHLRSDLFLDAGKFPKIKFNGTLHKKGLGYELDGQLTIKDVTNNIKLEVEYNGLGEDKMKNTRAGFEANGKINRKDYGITLNVLTDTGGLVVGDEIKMAFDIELIKAPVDVPQPA